PDILHTIHLGLIKDLSKWIHAFLKKLGPQHLEKYERLWTQTEVRRYPGLRLPTKTYSELPVDQLKGKEYRNYGRCLLAVVTAAVSSLIAPRNPRIAQFIRTVQGLTDFCIIAQYKSHDEET